MSINTADLVCIDYETVELLPDGSTAASPDFWKANFRVLSCAFSWYDDLGITRSIFVQGEDAVGEVLKGLSDRQQKVIVFNYQFELGVTTTRFPALNLNWYCDVMRLAQLYDNGGGHDAFDMVLIEDEVVKDIDDDDEDKPIKDPKYKRIALAGFGLSKCARRIIGSTEDHKAEAHGWIYANVPECSKGKAGRYLDRLPEDILERYNIADTETTLELYDFITTQFRVQEFDWTTDHGLYMPSVRRIAESEIRGIPVNREGLQAFRDVTAKEIENIGTGFRRDFADHIKNIEFKRAVNWILELKTIRGQRGRLSKFWSGDSDLAFNPGSNKQLAELFKDTLGIQPVFFTPKEAPSFKSAHLHQWGDGGQALLKRRKRLIAQKQAEAILKQSATDGRLHIKLKAVGTKTGRYAGSGGVNIQALSRREENLMNKLLPDPGYIFVSSDGASFEPSIITHYTKDKNYKYFCFDGIGKKPYYDMDLLMIDDMYLGYASSNIMFAKDMRYHFDNTLFDGKTFAEQWLINPDVVKEYKPIKFIRKNAKWMALAFGYGLGQKNVVIKGVEAGLDMKPADGPKAFNAYWSTFRGIKGFATRLENHTRQIGWFANDFGYRFVPEQPRKAFNGYIQSTVSSIFHWYGILMSHYMPEAKYVFTCHDEDLYMIPIGCEDKFRAAIKEITATINGQLKWDVQLRFGAVFGKDLYEAK